MKEIIIIALIAVFCFSITLIPIHIQAVKVQEACKSTNLYNQSMERLYDCSGVDMEALR